jgi:hypothetical protein
VDFDNALSLDRRARDQCVASAGWSSQGGHQNLRDLLVTYLSPRTSARLVGEPVERILHKPLPPTYTPAVATPTSAATFSSDFPVAQPNTILDRCARGDDFGRRSSSVNVDAATRPVLHSPTSTSIQRIPGAVHWAMFEVVGR